MEEGDGVRDSETLTVIIGVLLFAGVMSSQNFSSAAPTVFDSMVVASPQPYFDTVTENMYTVSMSAKEGDIISYGHIQPTGSMLPTINDQTTVIYLQPKSPDDLHVGDIILFDSMTHGRMTHRIIGDNGDGTYVTKGDNPITNTLPDVEQISFNQVRGRVVALIYGG
jgi:hypothetical protein